MLNSKVRAKAKSLERFQRIKRLRELGVPLHILKHEQYMMAMNRQGILRPHKVSPALERVLEKLNDGEL
ncbi:hypothetical protein P9VFCI_062 [Rhizobium phage P9VFCI]|uniref:Uncharacterized protein n=1 Tax=Rhizobium phage P9VFCI TaxID=2763531 RepID=A0A7G7WXR2_9CAUD|nr:hypothetical protein PP937_gp062 [Rhizobium phage P9VFCI]QNH72006.1 hypothetical protein P9VFCI_062 [Rhizobium phage P9VFCI]